MPRTCEEYYHVHWTEQDTVPCFLARHKLRLYWERTRELPPAADPGGWPTS